jgi:1,2-dihydroxy-3-keto-5-methylthiopentene dioxygenase
MATLHLDNGTTLTDLAAIANELACLNIQLRRWPIGSDPSLTGLLAQPSLGDGEKAQVLAGLDHYFQQLQTESGYTNCDLIVLNPHLPGLEALLARFDLVHTHADDEVRYIVDGAGVFGFVRADGSQVELTVQAQDYINIPAGTEHWFYLTPSRRIKAVRYFIGTEGWVPQYTDTAIRFRQPTLA